MFIFKVEFFLFKDSYRCITPSAITSITFSSAISGTLRWLLFKVAELSLLNCCMFFSEMYCFKVGVPKVVDVDHLGLMSDLKGLINIRGSKRGQLQLWKIK